MTIAASSTFVRYVRNGATTQWSYPNKIFAAADLVVTDLDTSVPPVATTLVLGTDYSVQNVDVDTGATVVTNAGGVAGHTLDIRSNIARTQSTSIKNQGQFLPELHEEAFDHATRLIQDLMRKAYYFGVHGPDTEATAWPSLPAAATRAGSALMFDSNGLPTIGTPLAVTLTQSLFNSYLGGSTPYAQTAAELAAGVAPTNFLFAPGDLRRYGGDPAGVADSSAAFQAAVTVGLAVIPQGCSFKILTTATRVGQVTIQGFGPTSKLLCDGTVATITSGTGSIVDNFWMENITAPYVITRNPSSWGTVIAAATQSNSVLGYQPTPNDPEYATLVAAYPSIATQNIGPTISFQGNASNIEVTRIFGRFVQIALYDAVSSSVHDCDFRAGKGLGGIVFWNINNQVGQFNKAYNNRVQYASYSGVMMSRNFDFTITDNTCANNGESGVKTYQDTVAGVDARCYRGIIADNKCPANYYDGVDALSSFATATLVAPFHKVTGNFCYLNGGCGINIDGQFNHVHGNTVALNYRYGIYAAGLLGLSFSSVKDNFCVDNNQQRSTSQHDIGIVASAASGSAWNAGQAYLPGVVVLSGGNLYQSAQTNTGQAPPNANYWNPVSPGFNHIAGNYVIAGLGQNNFGIYAPGTNFVGENFSGNGSTFFFGNPGSISSIVQNVADSASGLLTDQSFTLAITNTGGTIQHAIYSEPGGAANGLYSSRVHNATAAYTNTPTGTDSTTAMAGGGKIGSVNVQAFWCDTANQQSVNADLCAPIIYNDTGTQILVAPQFVSLNINGVTLYRLVFVFSIAGTGALFALSTANIAAGKTIKLQFKGKLA